jgi:predicted transcriptional regulator
MSPRTPHDRRLNALRLVEQAGADGFELDHRLSGRVVRDLVDAGLARREVVDGGVRLKLTDAGRAFLDQYRN